MKAPSGYTYELIVWAHCMELTLQLRAADVDGANRRVWEELGSSVHILSVKRVVGATSATHLLAAARRAIGNVNAV